MKAMEKDPARRYDRLIDMADDLTNWLEGRPLLARPIGPVERLRRWCERKRLPFKKATVKRYIQRTRRDRHEL